MTLLASSATPCMSQENAIKWDSLNSNQKQILAPLQDKWSKLSPAKQKRLNEGAKTWNALSLEKKVFKQILQTWKLKTLDEKKQMRNQFGLYQNLPNIKKLSLRKIYEEFKHLPTEKQNSRLAQYLQN